MNATAYFQADEETELGLVGAAVILGVCFLVGTPGNLLVVWTIVKHVKQRSHTVLLILHLAVADLLVLITLPLWIYSLVCSWVFGEAACKAMVYIINVCMYSSVFIITTMSVERFLAVRYPFASVVWRRRQALNKVLLMIWIASFLLSIPVIVTHTLGEDYGENQCLFREYETAAQEAVLLILESLVGFVIPFFTLLVCYGCLFSRIAQMNFKSKRKSTFLICSVVVMFALCWIPHHVGNLLSLISLALKHSDPSMANSLEDTCTTMTFIAGALTFISSSVNPVLYVFAARTFRSSLRETGIQKLFQHLSSAASGEGNKELSFVSKRQSSHNTNSQCLTDSKVPEDVAMESCINTSD
ncbi:leukotriene B4 receptor 1-like [Carassius gibelio]|uniref:leukotriene B4 receptor 1-like n=1 Tax=Carassius gibelio TaxID=101364 RepID=UPI0022774584|nr:leukotriene B4 receptor 1-like [Carassius gibelio]